MIASTYCPSTVVRGVVILPQGHPLEKFINDATYGSVISEYLGTYASTTVCTLHQFGYYDDTQSTDPIVQNTLIPDARTLLQSAQLLLNGLDNTSEAYQNIAWAMSNLQGVIDSASPSSADVAGAMAQLTQAMASAY
jgi:hypothetical protein